MDTWSLINCFWRKFCLSSLAPGCLSRDFEELRMTIRDTTVEDAAAVAAMIDLVARERRFLAGTVGFSEEATRNFIAQLRSADAVHIVAEIEGSLVGWCDIAPVTSEGMQHVGRLGMGVTRDFRGRGIGRRLLEA